MPEKARDFVKATMDKIRAGVHGARNVTQAIAIGLSEVRKAGVKLSPRPGKKAKTAKKRGPVKRHKSAMKAVKTKGQMRAHH